MAAALSKGDTYHPPFINYYFGELISMIEARDLSINGIRTAERRSNG